MPYSGPPCPADFNILQHCLLKHLKNESKDHVALRVIQNLGSAYSEQTFTYAELSKKTLSLAYGLKKSGLNSGDRLIIRLHNTSEYLILFLACLAIGVIPVCASSMLSGVEIEHLVTDSGAKAIARSKDLPIGNIEGSVSIFADEGITEFSQTDCAIAPISTLAEDAAYLIYTSGTSDKPKGVLHAQRTLWARRMMLEGWHNMQSSDIILHAGAFNWTYTLGVGIMDTWSVGATSVIYAGQKSPEIWPKLIHRVQATIFAAVPTLYRQILKYSDSLAEELNSIRHVLSAGESLPEDVAEEWFQRTRKPICEAFGMSEVSTYISTSPTMLRKSGSPGKPQNGRAIAILSNEDKASALENNQVGVLAVHKSDPGLMLRYWSDNQEDKENSSSDWFLTGDLALRDDDGYIWPQGRTDEILNPMGYRVSPLEIEAVLNSHPKISESAVIERQVRKNVHILVAHIVPENEPALSKIELKQYCQKKLADYKIPKEFVVTSMLPRTANGKLKRSILQ